MPDSNQDPVFQTELARRQSQATATMSNLDPAGDYGAMQKMVSAGAMTVHDTAGAILTGMTANAIDAVNQIAGGNAMTTLTKESYDYLTSNGVTLPQWHDGMTVEGAKLAARVNKDREFHQHVLSRSINNPGDFAMTLAGGILPGMVTGMPLNFLSKMLIPEAANIISLTGAARGAGVGALLGAAGKAGLQTAGTGLIESAALEVANAPMQEALGRDWQLSDSAMNVVTSPVYGAVLGFLNSAVRSSHNFSKYSHFKSNAKVYEDLTGIPMEQSTRVQQMTDASLATVNATRKNFKDALGRLMAGTSQDTDEGILQAGYAQFHGEMSNRVASGDMSAGDAQKAMESLTYKILEQQAAKVVTLSPEQEAMKSLYKKLFNREVKFFYTGDTPAAQKLYGRVYSGHPGAIYIARQLTGNVLNEVAGHEFWHSIEYGNPALAGKIIDAMDSFYSAEQLKAKIAATGRSQSAVWKGMTPEAKLKEASADIFSDAMTRKEFWTQLKNRDPEAFTGLVGFVKSIISKANQARENAVGIEQTAAGEFADITGRIVAAARAAGDFDKVPEKHIYWNSPPEIRGDKRAVAKFFRERNRKLYEPLQNTLNEYDKAVKTLESLDVGAPDYVENVDRLIATVDQQRAPQYLSSVVKNEPLLTQQPGFGAILHRIENLVEASRIKGASRESAMNAIDEIVSLTKDAQKAAKKAAEYKSNRLVMLKDPNGKVSFYRLTDSAVASEAEAPDWVQQNDPVEAFSQKHLGQRDDIVFEAQTPEFDSTEASQEMRQKSGVVDGEIKPTISLGEMTNVGELVKTVDDFLKQHPDVSASDKAFLESLFTKKRMSNAEENARISKGAASDKTPKKGVGEFLKKVIGAEAFDRVQRIVEDAVLNDLSYEKTPSRSQVDDAALKGWKRMDVPEAAWAYRKHNYYPEQVWDKTANRYDSIYHPSELLTEATKQSILENGYGKVYETLAHDIEQLSSIRELMASPGHSDELLPKRRNEIYNIGHRIAKLTKFLTTATDEKVLELAGFAENTRMDMLNKALLDGYTDPEQVGLKSNGQYIEDAGQYADMQAPEEPTGNPEETVQKGLSEAQELLHKSAKTTGDVLGEDGQPIDPARKEVYSRTAEFSAMIKKMADGAKTLGEASTAVKGDAFNKERTDALADLFKKDENWIKQFFGSGFDAETSQHALGPAVSEEMAAARGAVGGQVHNIISKHGRFDEFKGGKMSAEFEKSLYNYIGYGESTTDPLVKELGDFVKSYYDLYRNTANARGSEIPEAYGYVAPWDYSRKNVLKTGKANWVQRTLTDLNVDATISNLKRNGIEFKRASDLDAFLGAMYDSMEANKGNIATDPDDPIRIDTEITSNHRLLVFKPESAFDYFKDYSNSGSTFIATTTNLLRRAETMVALEAFGLNPSKNVVAAIETAGLDPMSGKGAKIMDLYNETMGLNDTPVNRSLAETGKWTRSIANSIVLGFGAVTATGSDSVMAPSVLKAIGGPAIPKEANFFEVLKHTATLPQTHPLRQFANSLGAAADNILATLMASTKRQKFDSWFYNMNGMNAETIHAETAYTISWARIQAELAENPHLIDEGMANYYRRYGLDRSDFDAAKEAVVEMEVTKGQKIKLFDPYKIVEPSVRRKWLAFLQDTRSTAILRPTAADKAFWKFGSRAGTPMGEAARIAFQYAHWTTAAKSRGLDRFRFALGGKGFRNMVRTGQFSKGITPLAQYAAAAFFAGWISLNVKEILSGREPVTFLGKDQFNAANLARVASNTTFGSLSNIMSGKGVGMSFLGPALTKPVQVAGSKNPGDFAYNVTHSLPFVNQIDALDNINNLIMGAAFGDQYQATVDGIEKSYKDNYGQGQLGL